MSPGGPKLEAGSGDGSLPPSEFVDDGEIQLAKLASTILGAIWLTAISGWILIVETIALVHVRVLDAIANLYVRVIDAAGRGGAETLEVSWSAAFRAAVDAEPMLAPAILTLEIIAVSALLLYARRRWF